MTEFTTKSPKGLARAGSGSRTHSRKALLRQSVPRGSRGRTALQVFFFSFLFAAIVTFVVAVSNHADSTSHKNHSNSKAAPQPQPERPQTLADLLALPASGLTNVDVAVMNLLCASALPGAETLDLGSHLATLDQWASHVKSETERHLYKFRNSPADYHNSEAYFRMLMMAVVVYEDFRVRYNPERISSPGASPQGDHFFADSQDVFLHGVCGSRRMGTCSSMPVLYVALGRRLGYPLKLVTTKAHVFLRWDSPEERFDLEATGRGMNPYDDNHFRQWPYPVTEEEVRTGGFLKSLTPPEELALFLSLRGNCLMEAGRASEAIASYAHAVRLAPDTQPYQALLSAAREAPAPPQSGSQIAAAPFPTRLSLPRAGVTVPVQAAQPPDPNPLLKIR